MSYRDFINALQPPLQRLIDHLYTGTFPVAKDEQGEYVRIPQSEWLWMQQMVEKSIHSFEHPKAAIVGSRSIKGAFFNTSHSEVARITMSLIDSGYSIVTGDAAGVDESARHTAESYGHPAKVFYAAWRGKDGKGVYNSRAGLERNTLIVEAADILVAFWDGTSTGTRDSIRKANQKKIPVIVFNGRGEITELYLKGERLL